MSAFREFMDDAGWLILGFTGGVFVLIFIIAALLMVPIYYSACRSAEIYNQSHATHWTCGDFFWAGNQINAATQTVRVR